MELVEDQEEGGSNVHMRWERIEAQPTHTECLDKDPKSKHTYGAGKHASLCQNIPIYLHRYGICSPVPQYCTIPLVATVFYIKSRY